MTTNTTDSTVVPAVATGGSARLRRWIAVPLALVTITVAAACGGNSGSSSGSSGTSASAPTASGELLSTAKTSLGTILVDGKGMTVYNFANDTGTSSTCVDACAADWKAVVAPASLPSSLPGVTGALGSTTRADGTLQVTVAGHPVYTFVGDSKPGQTNGQGKVLNGGLWTVVSPDGKPVAASGSASPSAPGGPAY